MDPLERLKAAFAPEEVLSLAGDLVRIPSHSQVPGRETEVAQWLAGWLGRNGIDVTLRPVVDERPNVIARLKGEGGGPALMLNGHLDTVPPYTMSIDPFSGELKDGRIWGRGSADMKGACAAMAMTLVALKRSGLRLAGDLFFTGVINEELKSEGSEDIVLNGPKADAVIVGEPSELNLSVGHRGLEWIEVEVIGRAAHGGRPHLGVNAISKMAAFIRKMEAELPPRLNARVHPLMGPPIFNLGVIHGGTQPSSVADRCVLQLDRRLVPGETWQSVMAELEEIIEICRKDDPEFNATLRRIPDNMATMDHLPMEFPLEHPLLGILEKAVERVTGRKPQRTCCTGWTDAALFANQGKTPALVLGPGTIAVAHGAEEHCPADQIVQAVLVYGLAALEFCGYSG
ncbi:MAG: M20 family metallopeptidase [Synergistaceae bacterium]|jgi:acetylornithine deacetylase/succinyl-diaminopimelate desuccinylase|nr:M20 family metallopeptidase [Synergistaceae bacterium]